MNVANERAKPRAIVDVLNDDESRRRSAEDEVPPIGSVVIKVAHRQQSANARRHRISDRRRKAATQAAD